MDTRAFCLILLQPQVIRRALGFGHNYSAFEAYIQEMIPLAHAIEALAPSGSNLNLPNPEYPFISPNGTVIAPCRHPFEDIWGRRMMIDKFRKRVGLLLRHQPRLA